jgi:hypothetical protein
VPVDLDMVVESDPAFLPLRELERRRRQRLERAALQRLEQLAAARPEVARAAIVQRRYAFRDRGIQLGQREEGAVPELGDDL